MKWSGAVGARIEELVSFCLRLLVCCMTDVVAVDQDVHIKEVSELAEAQVRYADSVDELRRGSRSLVGSV